MTNTPQITEEMKGRLMDWAARFQHAVVNGDCQSPSSIAQQILAIITPPQKVEPVELNCFIYQQANGQIYFTVNRVRNDTEMDHFTVRWSGKNTAEIVKGE